MQNFLNEKKPTSVVGRKIPTTRKPHTKYKRVFKVACTSVPFFEKKIMKRYPIFSVQINYYQIDQMNK